MNSMAGQVTGFDGEVSGMSLTDLLQIKSMGRFNGRIVVEHGSRTGSMFFRDGELVHAQLDNFEGKDAFARILAWGGGTFRAEPKVTTTRQTLTENLQFLMLDAMRLQDEILAGKGNEAVAEQTTGASKGGGGMKERLSGVAGLQDVALTDRNGTAVQLIGDNAEALAAQGMFLVSGSAGISDELGLGGFKGALVHGVSGHIIALEGTRNYLFINVTAETKPAVAEAEVKKALSNQR